ncbi:hypothetical protein GCK72_022794 [Caenorhabditis remanei]|nr:hypothetical protein GCK72_022794 [Caenorhabditis remanei]KAF1746341.1 hypothetical protein GCK72_022794 [Caenorhabditis remanei]
MNHNNDDNKENVAPKEDYVPLEPENVQMLQVNGEHRNIVMETLPRIEQLREELRVVSTWLQNVLNGRIQLIDEEANRRGEQLNQLENELTELVNRLVQAYNYREQIIRIFQ